MPGVSVIIPSYNHEKYVAEAIQSVLEQTYQDFEIVITDDGSTDGTVHEIKKFDDLRIRLYTFEKNQGACVAVNHCLHHAKGEYIAVLSSDDLFLPEKLEKQVKFLDKHPEIGAVFGFAQIIDDSGRDFTDQVHFYYDIFKQPNRTRYEWLNHFFYKGNCLCHPSILIRKTCYNTIGLYDPRFAQLPDFDFWIRLCMQYDIHIIQENLIKFRIRAREANVSGRRPDSIGRNQWEFLQIYKHYLQIPSTDEFLRIFPEAEKCVIQHPENNFVPALVVKLALDSPSHILHCFAINTLFDLLKDNVLAERLSQQYGLIYHHLITLTGKYEITPLFQTFAQLFIDTGFGFNEKQSIKHEIAQLETRLEFDLSEYNNIIALRFDPVNSMVVLQLDYIKVISINNTLHNKLPYQTNALYQKGEVFIFETCDPNIYIDTKDILKPQAVVIQVEYIVWGAETYKYIFEEQLSIIQAQEHQLQQQAQTLQAQEHQLQQQAQTLQTQEHQLQQQAQTLQAQNSKIQQRTAEIQAIKNTLSWKITKPLRTIWNVCHLSPFFSTVCTIVSKLHFPSKEHEQLLLCCDNVEFCSDTIQVSGWAISNTGIIRIEVYLDDVFLGDAMYGNPRHDVGKAYPSVRNSELSGFCLYSIIDSARFVKSRHTVRIKAIDTKERSKELRVPVDKKPSKVSFVREQTIPWKSDYEKWVYRNRLTQKMKEFFRNELRNFHYTPKFSIVLPVHNTPEDLLIKALESIKAQIYENWEVCSVNDGSTVDHVERMLSSHAREDQRYRYKRLDTNRGIVGASNEALKMVSGDYVVLMDHDDTLEKDALLQIAKYLQDHQDVDVIYTDNDKIDVEDNYLSSQFKPDWSPELMYSYCYVVHLKIFSKRIIQKTGLFREGFDGAQDYDYFLRAAENANKVAHIPLVLYHWREVPGQRSTADEGIEHGRKAVEDSLKRQGIDWVDVVQAEFAKKSQNGIYKLMPTTTFQEKVSIIITLRDQYKLVKICIDSIERKTSYRKFEIIIVDDESHDPATKAYLEELRAKYTVLRLKREEGRGFNFAKLNNEAVKSASGDYLVFLNADTEIISPDWLEEMLLYCRMPDVGIVGAKLLFSNGSIQHAGVIKGFFNGLACHAFKNIPKTERGYMDFAVVARNYSAVTAACLMIRKELFIEVGGFDEVNLPVAYNDVDLCLNVLHRGYRIVYNPYVELLHDEGSFRRKELRGSNTIKEEIYLREKWKEYPDIYYNMNQSLKDEETFEEAVGHNTRLSLFDLSNRKLKILSVSHNLNLEGAPKTKLLIDRYLQSRENVALQVLCLAEGPLHTTYNELHIPVDIWSLNWNIGIDGYRVFNTWMREYLRKGEFDLVYANTLDTFWAIEAAHAEHIPSIWNIHESVDYDTYFGEYQMNNGVRKIAKQTFSKSNRNLFVCHATAEMFRKYDLYGVSDVVYNGICLDEIESLREIDKNVLKRKLLFPFDKKIVSIIGTTCPRKGQLDFAKAAVNILTQRDDACFLIVGTREMDYLDHIRTVTQGEKQIYLIPETPDALKYFRLSDIFVCASYNESFPIVILEAMAFSLPIVTTPVFGIAEQIVDGASGLFFQPGHIHEMMNHINLLLNNEQLAEELGNNACLTAKTNFSAETMTERYYQLMQTVAFEDVNNVAET